MLWIDELGLEVVGKKLMLVEIFDLVFIIRNWF